MRRRAFGRVVHRLSKLRQQRNAIQLREPCESGLDLVEAKLHEQIALDLDAVRFAAGRARLIDADGDGSAEALTSGSWDARLDVGLGARAVTGRFTGVAARE